MEILKDVLIATNEIDRYLGGRAPINLWRAHNLSRRNAGVFDLIEEPHHRPGGVRPADITIEEGWVKVRYFPRGISTFDKPNVSKRGRWEYYKLPEGTRLPRGLVVVRDRFNCALDATHCTIAPAHDMRLTQFKALLNRLAIQISIKSA